MGEGRTNLIESYHRQLKRCNKLIVTPRHPNSTVRWEKMKMSSIPCSMQFQDPKNDLIHSQWQKMVILYPLTLSSYFLNSIQLNKNRILLWYT